VSEQAMPVAFITGGAKRIGAAIAQQLHHSGMDIAIHYKSSRQEAENLKQALEQQRPDSVTLIQTDLASTEAPAKILDRLTQWRSRLDVLVNNASAFYPTPFGSVTEQQWDELLNSNLKGPFFLSQALAPRLKTTQGCIINLVDIHADRPLKEHPTYCMAQAANAMMVKSLALELGPEVRVNGVAPGAILWPKQTPTQQEQQEILNRVPLQQTGTPEDIARTVLFLTRDARYVTGQIISVDGGRSIRQ